MKKLSLLWGLLLLCLSVNAQNPALAIPEYYLNFLTPGNYNVPYLPQPSTLCNDGVTPVSGSSFIEGYYGQNPLFTSNMIRNPQGDVEFFTIDNLIYDGEGNYIDRMANGGDITGASEMLIVPDPGNCDRYYIIGVRVKNYEKIAFVHLLDMSIPQEGICEDCIKLGALVPQPHPFINESFDGIAVSDYEGSIIPNDPSPYKNSNCFLAASDLQPGNFHWVFISNPEGIFRFKIDASGFSYDNSFIPFGSTDFNAASVRSEMELVELPGGGFRIAAPYKPANASQGGTPIWEYLFVADLDANADLVAGSIKRFPMLKYSFNSFDESAALKGIEFSEDGDRVYVTHNTNILQQDALEYYDFGTAPVQLTPFPNPNNYPFDYSMLELAEGDKLLLANQNGIYELPNATSATGGISQMVPFSYAPTYEGPYVAGPSSDFVKLYMLPDQIDGMDYEESFLSTTECCIASTIFEASNYSAISGNWSPNTFQNGGANPLQPNVSPDIYIRNELRIPAGVDLTIDNMVLHFAPGARLVIENGTSGQQGGKLTLNNTVLTVDERCTADEMWLGVEVWGNTNDLQGSMSSSNQGRLQLNARAHIEHAQIGVLVGKRNETEVVLEPCPSEFIPQPFSFDYGRSGGIVKSTNATFLGNQRGVYYLPYLASNGADNLGDFAETRFEWDGPLKGGVSPQVHAGLYTVKGIRFRGCFFSNNTPTLFPYSQLGTGIQSSDAQFTVAPFCPTLTQPCTTCENEVRSKFENLRFGIRTVNNNNLTFSAKRSDFLNNQFGIHVSYTDNPYMVENLFQVRQASYQTAGIAIYFSPNYIIEENNLLGLGSPVSNNSFGVVINNTGIADNVVYLNSFRDLHVGGQTEGNNAIEITSTNEPGGSFNMAGLNWTCNSFNPNIELADLTLVDGRMDYFQGHAIGHNSMNEATLGSARNRFSLDGEALSLEHDIMASTNSQELQYVGLNTALYFADSYTPNLVLPLISSYNGTQATATTGMCPSNCSDKASKYSQKESLEGEIGQLEKDMNNPDLSAEQLEAIEARLRLLREKLNNLVMQIISDALLSYESLEDLEQELESLSAGDLFSSLQLTYGEDLSRKGPEGALGEPALFLEINPSGGEEKRTENVLNSTTDLVVFPNPGTGHFKLQLNQETNNNVSVQVIDLMGRTVHTQSVNAATSISLNLQHLPVGMYNLNVSEGNELIGSQKIQIIR